MPTTLPVPSAGALRVLRHLALGTSCTVAVGAGLLTEDRRRRIHAARQVYDNAQIIKAHSSSRHYHGAGTIESFEEQALRHSDDAYWLPSNVARARLRSVVGSRGEEEKDKKQGQDQAVVGEHEVEQWSKSRQPTRFYQPAFSEREPLVTLHPFSRQKTSNRATSSKTLSSQTKAEGATFPTTQETSESTSDILANQQDEANFESDCTAFFKQESYSQHPKTKQDASKQRISPYLFRTGQRLFEEAGRQGKFLTQEQIVVLISRSGTVNEVEFQKFDPTNIMGRMVGRMKTGTGETQDVDLKLLKDAAAIFLTRFDVWSDKVYGDELYTLGEKLCRLSSQAGLHDLAVGLVTRLEKHRGDRPPSGIDLLIEAKFAQGRYGKVFRYFEQLYTQTSPDNVGFFKTGNVVVESLLKKKDLAGQKQFFALITDMSKRCGIQTYTSWFLKCLGEFWRSKQDIELTKGLFEHMVPYLSSTGHPHAAYSAIIQFSVEAGQEATAMEYYQRAKHLHPRISCDIRTLGHLALAKANCSDWDAVLSALQQIHLEKPKRTVREEQIFSSIFVPILKAFAKTHKVGEVENFVRSVVNECKLNVDPFLFNFMVGQYVSAKEISSLSRWIEFAASVRCEVNPITVNTLLTKFVRDWDFSFLEVVRLYQRIHELGMASDMEFTNATTTAILEKIAVTRASNDNEAQSNLACLKGLRPSIALNPESVSSVWQKFDRDLLRAYARGRFTDVLEIYRSADKETQNSDPKYLTFAVKAALDLDGDGSKATLLVTEARHQGQDISAAVSAIMVHGISKLDQKGSQAYTIAEQTRREIKALESHGIQVSPTVLTHTLHILVKHGHCQEAIGMFKEMSNYLGRSVTDVDLVTLTVLLSAYIQLRYNEGIRWTINILTENNLTPDAKFYKYLTNARTDSLRLSSFTSREEASNYQKCVAKACEQVSSMREASRQEKMEIKFQTIKVIENSIQRQSTPVQSRPRMEGANREMGLRQEKDLQRSHTDDFEVRDSDSLPMVTAGAG